MNTSQINPLLILVSEPTFLGVVWGCVGVSLCFVMFRVYVRLRVFRRIFDDDVLVILAWLVLLIGAALWHVQGTLKLLFESLNIEFGAEIQASTYFQEHLPSWLRMMFAETFLGIVALWCIKFSFLAFFRRLGHNVKGQKVLWWTVLFLTTTGLAISVGVIYYPCMFTTLEHAATFCASPAAGKGIYRPFRIQVGCDCLTDFLILLIPIQLLWHVQITLKQKIGLVAIFSLTIITMIICIVRGTISLLGPHDDKVFFFLCVAIELTVSIIIACIISYRALFTQEARNRISRTKSTATLWSKSRYKNERSHPYSVDVSGNKADRHGPKSPWTIHEDDGVEILPLDVIYVRNDVAVRSYDPEIERGEGVHSPV